MITISTFYSNNQPLERLLLVSKSFPAISSESEIALTPIFRAPYSAPTSHAASVNHPAPLSRTTVLNNIKTVTKATPQLKAKPSTKPKPAKTADNFDSGSDRDIGLSDEDDSQERKVALKSPEKGAEARKSIKVSRSSPMYCLD